MAQARMEMGAGVKCHLLQIPSPLSMVQTGMEMEWEKYNGSIKV